MDIKLNEREIAFLKQYAEKYEEERRIDITNTPIVVVENKTYYPTADGFGDKTIYVIEHHGEHTECETIEEVVSYFEDQEMDFSKYDKEILEQEGNHVVENIVISKFPVFKIYEPVAYFLTRAEADKYCKYQKHNLKSPRVYSRYVGYGNNGDLECLMQLLLKVGEQIIQEEKPATSSFIEKRFLEKR